MRWLCRQLVALWRRPTNDWDPHPIDLALGLLVLLAVATLCVVFLGLPANGQDYQRKQAPPAALGQIDLPLTPPALGGEPFSGQAQAAPENNEPADDPRDTPPPVFYGEEIDVGGGDSLVYVLDCSGSMGAGDPPRIERLREETLRSVLSLPENMRLELYAYSSSVRVCFGELVEADDAHKRLAAEWIGTLRASGGTMTGIFMAGALREHPSCKRYVLLSDGAPSGGTVQNGDMIRAANAQGAAIDCFGVEAYGKFRAFLQRVAAESGGSYVDVP